MDTAKLLEKVQESFLEAFPTIPEFGSIGFTVYLNHQEPVRIEWSGSSSQKLLPKEQRFSGGEDGR